MASSMLQLFYIQFPFIIMCCMAIKPLPKPYIVYMGSSSTPSEGDSHLQLLSSLIPSDESERRFLTTSYNHAFKGFSAFLTEKEASLLSGYDEVISVFPDPVLNLHTTRSWEFLEGADSESRSRYPHEQKSVDVIIGVIDTGIWPESPSFKDVDFGEIPSKWRGVCMESSNFKKSNCNRKLIGARFYSSHNTSPRDSVGHGTHTASIAGGVPVAKANYYGLAEGTAHGGLPSARLASYKVCTEDGCAGSLVLKAIDDAIKDGVDIISISIGLSSLLESDFLHDPIAIGAFHAEQKGVMVVCSGGNDGPDPYTIVNSAPWVFTVAASTIDRDFESRIVLGNNVSFEGKAINFSPLTLGVKYPLAYGESIAARFTPPSDARNCIPGSLDYTRVAGKIVVCTNDRPNVSRMIKKLVVEDAKAKGLIIIDAEEEASPLDAGTYPYAEIGERLGSQILHYLNSTKNPTATILAAREVRATRPAPVVASFSSRGPGSLTENILKPDIMAPGVAILAAIVPKIQDNYDAPGNKASGFGIKSGTSMACPHVTGAMAFIKSVHPNWSFSAIKSALMTTASTSTNMGRTTQTNASQSNTNPLQVGAGEIQPIKALDPGLVIETTADDHLRFLCHMGYNHKIIRSISTTNFTCPSGSARDLVSGLNYPTISLGRLDGPRKVKRVVTNVGPPNATYYASVNAPRGVAVRVAPRKMKFVEGVKTASFKVFFDGRGAEKGYKFGDVRWFDGSHVVRIVFAVNVV